MGINKNAYIRYKAIDLRLRNRYRSEPNMDELREACRASLGYLPSIDTIQLDIKKMRMDPPDGFSAPIKYCRRKMAYEYTDSYYSIDNIGLNNSDIEGIKQALNVIESIGSSRVSKQFAHTMGKLLSVYSEAYPAENKRRKIIQTDQIPVFRGVEHFDILFKACNEEIPISVVHYSYNKMIFNCTVIHPCILKEFENRWYIVGFSEAHNSIRIFGLDRLYSPILLNKKFIKLDQEEDVYYKDVYGVYPIVGQRKREIRIWASSLVINYFLAYPIHQSQKVENRNEDGSGEITFELIPSMELIRLFRSYGVDIEVLEPIWMKMEMTQTKK